MKRRVLLDEHLPDDLKQYLEPQKNYIRLVYEVGWKAAKNGELLRLIERSQAWDVFISNDLNLIYQHNRKFLQNLS